METSGGIRASLAGRYASALFDLARDQRQIDAVSRSLDALEPAQCDCAIIVASEEASVLAAVDNASRRGIVVMTLVSDLPGSLRRHFIGYRGEPPPPVY